MACAGEVHRKLRMLSPSSQNVVKKDKEEGNYVTRIYTRSIGDCNICAQLSALDTLHRYC